MKAWSNQTGSGFKVNLCIAQEQKAQDIQI